jgi:hypothetical protein
MAGTGSSPAPLPHETDLRLRKQPIAPRVMPASALIRNHHGIRDWDHFLGEYRSTVVSEPLCVFDRQRLASHFDLSFRAPPLFSHLPWNS